MLARDERNAPPPSSLHAPLRYLEIFQNSTAEDGASCHPDEYRESYQEAYEFCEATGMRQIYSRDDDGSGRCAYNPDVSNMEWYTHDCCAEDMDIPVTAGVTYWFAVTGAVGRAAAARARDEYLANNTSYLAK